ncbi:MAG TPA: YetF domain-containing protein [Alphaproteobacteria bacterium]|jgi:uncharacterized membrane protein YcaP (DUF421 family)|nr:YetF domain-containing protein [Alphaproteobacteria bacterium]
MHTIHEIFGTYPHTMTWWQMSARVLVVFFYAIILFRLFFVRVFGRISTLDITIAIMLGSTLSRVLTGNAPLVPSLVAITLLMALHALLVQVTFRLPRLGRLVKGQEFRLVAAGRMQTQAMRRVGISESDLKESLRLRCKQADLAGIEAAYLERDGSISFVRAESDGGG